MRRCEFELRSDAVRATLISSIFWYENRKKNKQTKRNKTNQKNWIQFIKSWRCLAVAMNSYVALRGSVILFLSPWCLMKWVIEKSKQSAALRFRLCLSVLERRRPRSPRSCCRLIGWLSLVRPIVTPAVCRGRLRVLQPLIRDTLCN